MKNKNKTSHQQTRTSCRPQQQAQRHCSIEIRQTSTTTKNKRRSVREMCNKKIIVICVSSVRSTTNNRLTSTLIRYFCLPHGSTLDSHFYCMIGVSSVMVTGQDHVHVKPGKNKRRSNTQDKFSFILRVQHYQLSPLFFQFS